MTVTAAGSASRPAAGGTRPRGWIAPWSRGPYTRRLRLVCGLILFTYVGTHLIDHALGNASIATMDAMLIAQKFLWQGVIGTTLLYSALLIHPLLGLWSLYARRYVGWTSLEVVQLVLGLCIPPLLANHLTVTRLSLLLFGNDKSYPQELHALWIASPTFGVIQITVLIVAWTHACIGLNGMIHMLGVGPRWRAVLLAGAVLLPSLALLGFEHGVREQIRAEAVSGWHPPPATTDTQAQAARLRMIRDTFWLGYAATIALVLGLRAARRWHETRLRGIVIGYPDGVTVRVPPGLSVLDASRMAGISHASVCGGRGRCSTCRVRVRESVPGALPAPRAAERQVLARVGVDPAMIRLACQTRPRGDVDVAPLIPPEIAGEFVLGGTPRLAGEEHFVVAMFVDLRDSTRLAATHLPYDSVFLIGRFVAGVARAVIASGGIPNQFLGDGVLALFGLRSPPQQACRDALAAVYAVRAAVAGLRSVAAGAASAPLDCGIGVHCGTAIVGEIGFGGHVTTTALGDVVNVAARLEAMTRTLACGAVISRDVYASAEIEPDDGEWRVVTVRGREATIEVRMLGRGVGGAAARET